MKKITKVISALAVLGALSAASMSVFATTEEATPATSSSMSTEQERGKRFYFSENSELTDEEKVEHLERIKEKLAACLADGKMTQEEYDQALADVEAGKLPMLGKGGSGKGHGGRMYQVQTEK